MKKTTTKTINLPEIRFKLDNILTSQQKLWEIVCKLDKDILAVSEVTARLLLEYKAIRQFEAKFAKTYKKDLGETKKNPYY